jgi:hypothetical protein
VSDGDLAALLGVHDQAGFEAEHPDGLLVLTPHGDAAAAARALAMPPELSATLRRTPAMGTPNRLSQDHQPWPIIDAVSAATEHPGPPGDELFASATDKALPILAARDPARAARRLFHQRRSAVDMDGVTGISAETFFAMLARCGSTAAPLDALPWRPLVDLVLLVHRVTGLDPGLYVLVRDPARLARLRAACKPGFAWTPAPGSPEALGCWLLVAGDVQHAAKIASCGQDIAADGAFAVGMLADFAGPLRAHGPWLYRRLFWETGAIGQVLYLESEAAGVRATGIGCFFDDVMHTILGLPGEDFQNLYNFTVGGPVEDERIQVEPAYAPDVTGHRTS